MSEPTPLFKIAHFRGSAEADEIEKSLRDELGVPTKQRHITGAAGANELLQLLLPYAPLVVPYLAGKLAEKYLVDPAIDAAGRTAKDIVAKLKGSPALSEALATTSREMAKSRAAGNSTSIGIEIHPINGRNAVIQVTEDDPERLGLLLLLLVEHEERIREILGPEPRPSAPKVDLPAKYESARFDCKTPDVSISIRLDETTKRLYFPLTYCIDGDWSPKGIRSIRYYVDNGEIEEQPVPWEYSV